MRSLTWFNLNDRLTVTGTSVGITNDNRGSIATYTNESVVAISDDGKTFEMMQINAAAGVMTIVKRGLDNSSVKTEVPGLKKERGPNTKIFITALASDFVASNTVNTWSAKQIFGDVDITGILNLLALGDVNVTGKSNPQPNFATTTERDLFYTAPLNGDKCTVDGVDYSYNGSTAQWEAKGVSTPLPKATELIEGKMALATLAEVLAGIVADKAVTPATLAGRPSDSFQIISYYPLGEPITTLANSCVFKETAPTFAQATTAQNIGDVAGNTRVSLPAIGTGVAGNSLKLSLAKVLSPTAFCRVRIETSVETNIPEVTAITGTYIASASGVYNAYSAYKAFDGGFADPNIWHNALSSIGWIKIQLPVAVSLYKYRIISAVGGSYPTAWTFEGSNNNSTWTTLDTRTGQVFTGAESKEYTCTSGDYLYYRVNVTAYNTNTVIAEVQLFRVINGVFCTNNMLGMLTADTTTGVSSQDTQSAQILYSPSGTLVNANATKDIDPATLTTSLADTTVTFPGSFTVANGTKVHTVVSAVGDVVNAINYYKIGTTTTDTSTRALAKRNTTRGTATSTIFPYISSTLFHNTVLSLTDSDFSYKVSLYGVATALGAVGSYPKLTVFGASNNFTGMTEGGTQYLGPTPGGIQSTAGTNSFVVGKARNATKLRVKDLIS